MSSRPFPSPGVTTDSSWTVHVYHLLLLLLSTVTLVLAQPSPADPTPTSDPLVDQARVADALYSTLFEDGMLALQVVIIGTASGFGVCYLCNAGYRILQIHKEVNKYIAISKPPPPPISNYTNVQATAMANSPTNMTVPSHNMMTFNMSSIQFQGAGIGFMGTNYPGAGMMPPQGLPNRDDELAKSDDTMVALDTPVFSMPGYLLMDFTKDVRLKGKIAEGGGGVVYKAELLSDEFAERFGFRQAVVKVLKPLPNMSFMDLKTIVHQEIAVMQSLSGHPNIITLVGYTDEPLSITTKQYDRSLFGLVMSLARYAKNSSEYDMLKRFMKSDSKLKKGLLVKGFDLLPEISLHIAWGMANGMGEMHRLGILHRDLKSANVLLEYKPLAGGGGDQPHWMTDPALTPMVTKISGILGQSSLAGGVGWGKDPAGRPFCPVNPVICDFGLAKMIKDKSVRDDNVLSGTAVKGMREANAVGISYRYAAPEAFNRMYQKKNNEIEAKPVDVFAFGVMCWEMLERKIPFQKLTNPEVEAKIKGGERPPFSDRYLDLRNPPDNNRHIPVLIRLTQACWNQDPRERPSFEEIKAKTRQFWLGTKDIK